MLAGIEAMTRESMGKEREVVVDEVKVGEVFYERSIYRVPEARLIRIFAVDITEKKQLEKQFLHAQKMEAIGRLAGGVAHDFNNILTAILGYRELIARRLGADHQLQKEADEIRKAAERAATLTRQLLAFSRKQVLEPRVLNLNVVVHDLETMLRRLIGENIALVIKTDSSLGRVKADPSQIEQIIVNLAVNARDAMLPLKRDGVLSVQTMDATVDEDEAGRRADLPAGRYAVLAIRDTGLGMSDEVKAHLFEPFFTTKNKGEGTGLGLATCYGIIKQSGGHITVASELGRGTTFSIYLPVVAAPADVVAKREESGELPRSRGHGESVLVVEDESAVRELCTLILRELGYTVLEAADGQEAIRVLEAQGRKAVSLVLTDVVMPHVGGKELADWVAAHSPQSKLLFISGYADDDTGLDTMIERGAAFLQKPFTGAALARKVRDVLDS
jgi:signal transduction histidine kinase